MIPPLEAAHLRAQSLSLLQCPLFLCRELGWVDAGVEIEAKSTASPALQFLFPASERS